MSSTQIKTKKPFAKARRQIAAQLAPLPQGTVVACIGPRTAFDARAAGLTVDLIAEARSADSLVAALVEHAQRSGD